MATNIIVQSLISLLVLCNKSLSNTGKFFTSFLIITALLLSGCGGSGDSGSPFAGTNWKGTLSGELTGTWTFKVASDSTISGTVVTPAGNFNLTGGLLDSGVLTGTTAENANGYAQIYGTISESTIAGTWQGDWGLDTLNQVSNGLFTGSKEIGSTDTTSCEWDPTSFYNEKQVVSYQGVYYTALNWITPVGENAAAILNPASNTTNWTKDGNACGPTPYIKVESAKCTLGTTADVVTITGTALGGGIGDAIAAYTNLTDYSFSVENNFGLPDTNFSITCNGGGWDSTTFSSETSPAYSVCVKTQASDSPTSWTSTQTISHYASSVDKITTAYASKGHPHLATVFNVGSIVLGLDAVRSEGVTVVNCN